MDSFYNIVLIVALVMLIILLIVLGTLITESDNNVYPPTSLKCPDYWVETEEGCEPQGINDGGVETALEFYDETKSNYFKTIDYEDDEAISSKYTGISDVCARRKWALNSNVVWDGVSNYNSC